MTPFLHTLSEATRQEDLMGEVGVLVFSVGWVDLGAKKKFEKFLHIIPSPPQKLNYSVPDKMASIATLSQQGR